ncbi:hypothetical protein LPB142_17745 (plasmid) [Rhodobacter xanthinilyticus]|uniref:Uncharacterized protein n=1 Tax=Rhodobacter xanthinilyticus TaxID=1850250 RepID=A0A1D9MHQ9_9RHOB|nr:hypothetical protein [Rhodobacter xanthinilyticus]AOZ71299.1 hypothetical protein LPB142_17745 [Rhodobacter xanthinilyticus]
MAIAFQFALDANLPIGISVANAEEIDTVLALTTSAIPLNRRIIENATPQYHRRTLKRLLICGPRNLGGGEQ